MARLAVSAIMDPQTESKYPIMVAVLALLTKTWKKNDNEI